MSKCCRTLAPQWKLSDLTCYSFRCQRVLDIAYPHSSIFTRNKTGAQRGQVLAPFPAYRSQAAARPLVCDSHWRALTHFSSLSHTKQTWMWPFTCGSVISRHSHLLLPWQVQLFQLPLTQLSLPYALIRKSWITIPENLSWSPFATSVTLFDIDATLLCPICTLHWIIFVFN